MMRITLFVTMGDPAGIGPEVVVKALSSHPWDAARLVVVGDRGVLERAASVVGVALDDWQPYRPDAPESARGTVELLDLANVPAEVHRVGVVDPAFGQAAYEYVVEAVQRCLAGEGMGLVTAPLNKAALNAAGHHYRGHTELIAHLCGVQEPVMMLVAGRLRVSHVSTHCSLREAVEMVRAERIVRAGEVTLSALSELGVSEPRLAVAGLNPHAGEGGLFGQEEAQEISPAVEQLRARGHKVVGPLPADTVFLRASRGEFDAVLAMYHDQGHIPVKMVGFEEGVNVTLGLPIIRTSVDHGTAFDIAGTGRADARSMMAAIALAVQIAAGRAGRGARRN